MADASKDRKQTARKPLTQERVKELLHYDPLTGMWEWRVRRGRGAPGRPAGTLSHGYRVIKVDRVFYPAGRLAIFYMTGVFPKHDTDHHDRNISNDKFENLRPASRSENNANAPANRRSGTGARGVHFHKGAKRFRVQITKNRKTISLGYCDTIEEGSARYLRWAKEIHGEFSHS